MRQSQFPLSTQFYADASRDWSVQDVVNYVPEIAEVSGTASQVRLRTAPGLREEIVIGDSPIRGIHNAEGAFFVVQATTLFQYVNGVLKALGNIPGAGPVQITHNQFQTGNQVLVENGQPGGGYIWDTNSQTFSNITDPGYPGSISTDYLDQYMIAVEPLGRFWFHSNLADASDYNTLDRYESEASPDKIVAIKAINGDVMVLNQTTIEFFRNTGAATGTFQRIQGAIINEGCAGGRSVVRMDNSVMWLGSDGVIYRLNGYAAQPISTRALERAISGLNWSNAIGFTLEQESHKIYYLHFPDGPTFGYDVTTQLWHRRSSMASGGYDTGRWRLTDVVPWNNKWMAADIYTGKIWSVDWGYFLEGQLEFTSRMVSPVNIDDRNAFIIDALELLMDTGEIGAPEDVPPLLPITPQTPDAPTITGTPPSGQEGIAYSFSYTITGAGPLTVTLVSGTLPTGLTLSSTGVVSGTPTSTGTAMIVARVTDIFGRFAEIESNIFIATIPYWNPADRATFADGQIALTDSNKVAEIIRASGAGAIGGMVRAVSGQSTGIRYAEFLVETFNGALALHLGIIQASASLNATPQNSPVGSGHTQLSEYNTTGTNTASGPGMSLLCRFGISVNFSTGVTWMHVDGVYPGGRSPDSSPGTGSIVTATLPAATYYPYYYATDTTTASSYRVRLFLKAADMLYKPAACTSWSGL